MGYRLTSPSPRLCGPMVCPWRCPCLCPFNRPCLCPLHRPCLCPWHLPCLCPWPLPCLCPWHHPRHCISLLSDRVYMALVCASLAHGSGRRKDARMSRNVRTAICVLKTKQKSARRSKCPYCGTWGRDRYHNSDVRIPVSPKFDSSTPQQNPSGATVMRATASPRNSKITPTRGSHKRLPRSLLESILLSGPRSGH